MPQIDRETLKPGLTENFDSTESSTQLFSELLSVQVYFENELSTEEN